MKESRSNLIHFRADTKMLPLLVYLCYIKNFISQLLLQYKSPKTWWLKIVFVPYCLQVYTMAGSASGLPHASVVQYGTDTQLC